MTLSARTRRTRSLLVGLASTALLGLAAAAPAQDAWADLGQGLAGTAGTPSFSAQGTLIGGTNYTLQLSNARPNAQAYLVLGFTDVNAPLKGGTLVPAPDAILGPFSTGPAGLIEGELAWALDMPAGEVDFWQIWISDPVGPFGWAATNALSSTTPEQLGGSFPDEWIHGGDCPNDPLIQVHRYNDDTYILRQSMCSDFEGPFMFLLFGDDTVLMQDTGAGGIPIAATVDTIIDEWLLENGKSSIDLLVTHSHAHGDHVQGDSQFAGRPNTTVVGLSQSAVASFFGIAPWPTEFETIDLGGRVLDVLAIPGHQSAHLALYDRETALLFTGDSLYPGFIFLNNAVWNTYKASISRLRDFVDDKPIAWVLGTHVEMTEMPFVAYPYGTNDQPRERVPQLEKKHLVELDEALDLLPTATVDVHADFIIDG